MNARTSFSVGELEAAVTELVRLRLVEGWAGDLRIEYDTEKKQLAVGQYESNSTWTECFERIYSIAAHEDWNDFIFDCGVHGTADEVRLDVDQWENSGYDVIKEAKIEDGEYILEGALVGKFFEELDWSNILESGFQSAYENLRLAIGEKEVEA